MILRRYIGEIGWKGNLFVVLTVLFAAFVCNGFSFSYWPSGPMGRAKNLTYLLLAFYALMHKRRGCGMNFSGYVELMMWLPCFSMINAYQYHNQSFVHSFVSLSSVFILAVYFLLHKWRVKEGTLLKAFLCISLIILAIQVIQQFTYPDVLFGVKTDEELLQTGGTEYAAMRNGLWRFRMHFNGYFTTPILFAVWVWMRKKFSAKLLLLDSMFLVSIYLTLTRQVMFACIMTLFFSAFMGKKKINYTAIFMGVAFILGLYIYYDVLFSSLADQTKEESTNDNIRIVAATYFMEESLKTPLTLLFGYGRASIHSDFYLYQLRLTNMGLYTCDVGFIGQIFEFGLPYVIVCYLLLHRVYFRFKKQIPTYIRMFALYSAAMSPMIFSFFGTYAILTWAILLYVCDLHINKSPLALKTTKLT